MDAVADDLGGNEIALEDRPHQPGLTMPEWRHAIEQVRGVPRARGNPLAGLRVGGARMPERHAVAVVGQVGDEIEDAVDLGRDGDNPDVATGGGDLIEDVGA